MTLKNYRVFISIVFTLIALKGRAENSIIVKLNNGNTSGILLSSLDKITFSEGNMIISMKNNTANSFSILNVQNMFFGIYSDVQGVSSETTTPGYYPNPAQDFIILKNTFGEKANVEIYGMDGSLKVSTVIVSENEPIDIKHLRAGLYILKANNTTFKLMKK